MAAAAPAGSSSDVPDQSSSSCAARAAARAARRRRRWPATSAAGTNALLVEANKIVASRCARRSRSCPWRGGRTDADRRRAARQSASTARTAGLSSSCRIADHRFRPALARPRGPGRTALRATSSAIASTSSKSSERQVHVTIIAWRGGRDAQRHAAVVELFGQHVGRSRVVVPRSSTRPSRYARPGRSAGSNRLPARTVALMVTAGVIDVCCAMTTAPFGEHGSDRRQAAWPAAVVMIGDPVGWNQPTVRVAAPRRRRATSADLLGSHRVDLAIEDGQEPRPGDRLEVAELVGDVGDAVVLEHEPGAQLTTGAGAVVLASTPLLRIASIDGKSRGLERGKFDALDCRQRQRVEERLRGRQQRAADGRGERRARRAPCRAAPCAAAARRGSWPRD